MKFLLTITAFLLGVVAAMNPLHIEKSGDGDGELNVYLIIGFVNIIPANFNDNTYANGESDA